MILLPWLTIQAADMFLNNNPKFKPTMSIPAILSEGKDPLGLPDPVPQQIVVLPNDRDAHMPIVFPVTFLHTPTRRSTLPTSSPRHILPPFPLPPPPPPP